MPELPARNCRTSPDSSLLGGITGPAVVVALDEQHHHPVDQGAVERGDLVGAVRRVDADDHLVPFGEMMGVQGTEQPLGGGFDKLENRLQGILLLGPVQLVAMDHCRRFVIAGPPGRTRPVHDIAVAKRYADQITDLHLPQPQRHIFAARSPGRPG